MSATEIRDLAMQLPPDERALLARDLLSSVADAASTKDGADGGEATMIQRLVAINERGPGDDLEPGGAMEPPGDAAFSRLARVPAVGQAEEMNPGKFIDLAAKLQTPARKAIAARFPARITAHFSVRCRSLRPSLASSARSERSASIRRSSDC